MRGFLVLALLAVALAETYHGEQVFRITPHTEAQVQALVDLYQSVDVDFWKEPAGIDSPVHLHVSRAEFDRLLPILSAGEPLEWGIMIHDIQQLINNELDANLTEPFKSLNGEMFECINRYTTYEVTNAWLDEIVQGSTIARVVTIGNDLSGLPIRGVEVDSNRNVPKPHYYIDGGIHAREWISIAVVKNFLLNLIRGHATGVPGAIEMLRNFRWTVVPIVNVDGYRWTHSNARLWRKTRRNNGDGSFGVDPNRNSDIQWCGQGSSRTPSSDTYCGPSPFSEPCVRGTMEYIQRLGNVKAYWNYHAYGQDLFIPFGYTTRQPANHAQILAAANAMAAAIRATTGLTYRVWRGNSIISGDLSDYIKEVLNVPYSGVPELRDTGAFGFLLPESQICANSQEIWEGMIAHARYVAAN